MIRTDLLSTFHLFPLKLANKSVPPRLETMVKTAERSVWTSVSLLMLSFIPVSFLLRTLLLRFAQIHLWRVAAGLCHLVRYCNLIFILFLILILVLEAAVSHTPKCIRLHLFLNWSQIVPTHHILGFLIIILYYTYFLVFFYFFNFSGFFICFFAFFSSIGYFFSLLDCLICSLFPVAPCRSQYLELLSSSHLCYPIVFVSSRVDHALFVIFLRIWQLPFSPLHPFFYYIRLLPRK